MIQKLSILFSNSPSPLLAIIFHHWAMSTHYFRLYAKYITSDGNDKYQLRAGWIRVGIYLDR